MIKSPSFSIVISIRRIDMGCDFIWVSLKKPVAYEIIEGSGASRSGQALYQHGPIVGAGCFF